MLAVIVIAVVAGLVGGAGNYLYLKKKEPKGIGFLVANQTIEPKQKIAWGDNVTSVQVPEPLAGPLCKIAIETANREIAEGKVAYDRILAGEPILYRFVDPLRPKELLFDEQNIAPNFRAISINVGREGSVSNIVQPGDRVDILGTFTMESPQDSQSFGAPSFMTESGAATPSAQGTKELLSLLAKPSAPEENAAAADLPVGPFTQTILQNMLVVGTGEQFRQGILPLAQEFPGDYDVVTFRVSQDEAELLTFAQSMGGKLTLVLRNPDDTAKPVSRPPMTIERFAAMIKGDDTATPVPSETSVKTEDKVQ